MTPHTLTESLKAACGASLKSVVLYGSTAAGDHAGRRSDYNVLVLLSHLGMSELKKVSPLIKGWVKVGNPPPIFLTPEELTASVDVFPLELMDLKESHRILFGENWVSGLTISPQALRLQLERELNEKLIQLRERYLLVGGNSRQLKELLIRSLSSVLALLRGILRFYQPSVPAPKMEAVRMLAKHIPLRIQVFEAIDRLKRGEKVPGVSIEQLFSDYVQSLETAIRSADKLSKSADSKGGVI